MNQRDDTNKEGLFLSEAYKPLQAIVYEGNDE
jgi:hypothetical protein